MFTCFYPRMDFLQEYAIWGKFVSNLLFFSVVSNMMDQIHGTPLFQYFQILIYQICLSGNSTDSIFRKISKIRSSPKKSADCKSQVDLVREISHTPMYTRIVFIQTWFRKVRTSSKVCEGYCFQV